MSHRTFDLRDAMSPLTHAPRLIAALAAATTALAFPMPTTATAAGGTFRQILCATPNTDDATDGARATDGLTASGTATPWRPLITTWPTCDRTGAMDVSRAIVLGPKQSTTVPADAWAALRYELAQPGLTLAGGTLYRAVAEATNPDDVTITQHAGADASNPRSTPINGWDFWPARSTTTNPTGSPHDAWSGANDTPLTTASNTFTITARCEPDTGATTCSDTAGAWRYVLFGASLTIRDDADPQVSNVRGGLAGGDPTAGELEFTASDVGAGVYRAHVILDDRVAHTQLLAPDASCRDIDPYDGDPFQFAHQRPCPGAADVVLSWNTGNVTDGAHDLRVVLEDAAGNSRVVVDRMATFDHVPSPRMVDGAPPQVMGDPTLGATLTPSVGGWSNAEDIQARWQRCNAGGDQCLTLPAMKTTPHTTTADDIGHRLRLTVTATNRIGETATATSAPSAVITGPAAQLPPPSTPAQPARDEPGGVVEELRRLDATPAPLANGSGATREARLMLSTGRATRIRRRFNATTRLTGRLTDRAGRTIADAEVRVLERYTAAGATESQLATVTTAADGTFTYTASKGPSRTLTAAYRAYSTDTSDSTRAQVRFVVPAEVTLTVRPAEPGRTTLLTGRLKHLPRPGVTLEVQAKDGKRWRTFDTTRTRRNGTYRFGYRFKPAAAGRRFALRIVVGDSTYPFARAASRARRVRVPR